MTYEQPVGAIAVAILAGLMVLIVEVHFAASRATRMACYEIDAATGEHGPWIEGELHWADAPVTAGEPAFLCVPDGD